MSDRIKTFLAKHGLNNKPTTNFQKKTYYSKKYQQKKNPYIKSARVDGSYEFNPITKETTYYSPEETKKRDEQRKWIPVSSAKEYLKTPGPKVITKRKILIWNKETK